MPLLSFQSAPPAVRADDLSNALAQQQALQKRIAQQKQQLAQLTAQQGSLQNQINSTRDSLANVSEDLTVTQTRINTLHAEIGKLQTEYEDTVAQLGQLEDQLTSIQAQEIKKQQELAFRKDLLAKRLIAAYQESQTSLLEQLLQSDSIADVLSDVSYYFDFGDADKALGLQIEQDQRTLFTLQQTVEQTRDATDQLRQQQLDQKKQLDSQVSQLTQAQAKLASLKTQIQQQLSNQQVAEAALANNKSELAKEIQANGAAVNSLARKIDQLVAQQASRGGIPSRFSGSMIWPMGGSISQPFGCTGYPSEPAVGNCAHFHQGIDIVAPCGTPIRAAAAGRVVFVGYNPYDAPPAAWIVIIAHASNLETWYAHMIPSRPSGVYAGAWVNKGQLIAWEGTTGHSTGCHLHWMVELNGNFVNPLQFV